ncbi:ABC transporter permease [Carnimonas bestiolae]|uniref:ABC transporter permease n=1 Tax=Carnimonas bestiolae TaxID=3402172 RepID=UPI003EDB9777
MTKRRSLGFETALGQEVDFLRSDRITQTLLFGVLPLVIVLMAALFSRGVTQDVPVAVVDHDHSAMSRQIISNINASRDIALLASVTSNEEAQHLMRTNKVFASIEIPRGAEGALFRGDDRNVAIRYNTQWRSVGSIAYLGLQNAAADAMQSAVNSAMRGRSGASAPAPFTPQITAISNAQNSFERFLVPIAISVVSFIALGGSVVRAYGRVLFTPESRAYLRKLTTGQWFMDAFGRITPYALITLILLLCFWVWFVQIRGWPFAGSAWLFIAALVVMCYATGCISIMMLILTRATQSALGISTLYASAALSYGSATLSLIHAGWWAKFWSGLQPFTHYFKIQMEQVNLGSDISVSLHNLGILSLYIVIPLLLGRMLFNATYAKPIPGYELGTVGFTGFKDGYGATIKDIFASKSLKSTAVSSLVLFSLFYPAAYSSQVNDFIPVAVVDLDHSSLSQEFIKNLKSTRVVDVTEEPQRTNEAMQMLRNRQVYAAITIDTDFKHDIERGGQGGVLVQMNGGYMSIAGNLQSTIVSALTATRDVDSPPGRASGGIAGLPLYNHTNGYETFVMPLVFVLILQQTTVFGASMLTAMRRGQGLWSLNSAQFFGTLCGWTTVSFLGACFVFGLVYWWLAYPLLGNLFVLVGLALMFSVASSALGMLIGSFLDRIYQTSMLLGPTSMLTFYATGGAYATFNIPDIINDVFMIFPSTLMTDGFSMLNSQGATPHEMLPIAGKLCVLMAVLVALAWWRLVICKPKGSPEGPFEVPEEQRIEGVNVLSPAS